MKKLSILFLSVLLSSNVFSNEKNIADRSIGISENSSVVGTNQVGILNNHVEGKKIYIEGIIMGATASHGIFSIEVKITKGDLIGKTIEIYLQTSEIELEEGEGGLRFDFNSLPDAELEEWSQIHQHGTYGQIVNGIIFEKKSKFDDYTGDSPYNWQTVFRPFELHLKRQYSSNVNAQSQYPEGSVFGPSGPTAIVDVTNPKTGKTWMDRNLGATRAATSSTDAASYGDLYQWGRRADGHQLRNSATTTTLSSLDQPAHGSFIAVDSGFNDWHDPQNDNLWQGVNGVNNPCPTGYRIPTRAEWDAERLTWTGGNNAKGAFASPLKLPMAGFRYYSDGLLTNVGSVGDYWSGTVSSAGSSDFGFASSNASAWADHRASGFSVRCIKD